MNEKEPLIPKHGGYRNLKTFKIAQLIYDVTMRFCNLYIDKRSRTHDQMVQAARSGPQNIAEGSQASGTSKKTELKLTSVARASLEELKLDYQDFLRHRSLEEFPPNHASLVRFKKKRCETLQDFQQWIREERNLLREKSSVALGGSPCKSMPSSGFAANGALSLINVCCRLLDNQIASQADSFEKEGGFSERLYRRRQQRRQDV
ncbi:four helix bundle protein [Candidatus Sumerlaeota bacterium]|nr:four helix bundle protein [Candidatus Sumerlaeota bacterium]